MTHYCKQCGTECSPPGPDYGDPLRANDGAPVCSPKCQEERNEEIVEDVLEHRENRDDEAIDTIIDTVDTLESITKDADLGGGGTQ